MEWRRAWAADWDRVRYCSDACRRHRGTAPLDRRLEQAIRDLLRDRGRGKTICPSEAARAVRETGWRELMPRTRAAARRLVAAGELEILQAGRPVDPSTARGPIRLRLASRG